jgi:hypothetical protein
MADNPNPRSAQYTFSGMVPEFYNEVVMTANSTQDIFTFLDHAPDSTNVSGVIEITYTDNTKETISSVKRTI